MNVEHLHVIDEAGCTRALGRISMDIPARLSLIDGSSECTLLDLSLEGARISTGQKLKTGDAVFLVIENYDAFGIVVWAFDGCAGILFEERPPKEFLLYLKSIAPKYQKFVGFRAAKQWASGIS